MAARLGRGVPRRFFGFFLPRRDFGPGGVGSSVMSLTQAFPPSSGGADQALYTLGLWLLAVAWRRQEGVPRLTPALLRVIVTCFI